MPNANTRDGGWIEQWSLPAELLGKRVRLEQLTERHFPGLHEAAQAPEIWRWMPADLRSKEALRTWMEQAFANRDEGRECPFAIIAQKDGRILGSTRFMEMDRGNRSVEIGWTWLHPSAWGTGLNKECKFLLLRHAFDVWGVVRVQFKTDARNVRSRKVIEGIGAVFEGILRCHRLLPGGRRRDSAFYSIVDTEWPHVRGRLEEGETSSE